VYKQDTHKHALHNYMYIVML